ncbi:MAG TPA: CcmD family protein [Bryobacterales bacterium]|jgi:CcmD family protein|nr:CcmD family protein [Bryobacterales bacterium]
MEENFKWLWYAFSAAWVLVVAYLFSLGRRESKLRDELESLKSMIEERQRK